LPRTERRRHHPEGGGVLIDLVDDWNARTMCKICWDCGPDWSGTAGEMLDYSNPVFLAEFTENLRAVDLDPRSPEWPLDRGVLHSDPERDANFFRQSKPNRHNFNVHKCFSE
jgi:hypothetical protein